MLGWAAEVSGDPKDPAIKLFGKTIPLPEIPPEAAVADSNQIHETGSQPEDSEMADTEEREDDEEPSKGNPTTIQEEDEGQCPTGEDAIDPDAASGVSEKNKASSVDKESATQKASKSEEEQSETSNSQEKPLKKPAKILPCPRCNSMDTKFCYYNNYNVNQPRHFCKNCQRYWTSGGTMRNVPVGAGRRKNKSSTSQYHRHVTVSEAFQNVPIDIPNGVNHVRPDGTVFTFGSSEAPLCQSMASALNLADKTTRGSPRNGFHNPGGVIVPGTCGDKHLQPLNRSPAMVPNTKDTEGENGSASGYIHQAHCYPGAPWPYPWNLGHWGPALPMAPPYCPTGFAVPFFPPAAAYWGCSVQGAWSVPWVPGPSSLVTSSPGSGPNSPTLGKHSRDEQNAPKESSTGGENDGSTKEASAERCLWIPKTLRIDDPGEAAKSSIWATLGIKNDKAEPVRRGGLFKAFQLKGEERNHSSEASPVLKANPAALSRSVNFHENS